MHVQRVACHGRRRAESRGRSIAQHTDRAPLTLICA
jgi:hypothetical protein